MNFVCSVESFWLLVGIFLWMVLGLMLSRALYFVMVVYSLSWFVGCNFVCFGFGSFAYIG